MAVAAGLADLKGAIVRSSLSDSVYESLLEHIVTGRLPSGTELSEVALAERLEVSRTPVHEALRRLIYDGLVEQLANRKTRVARFGRDDIREVYELRAVLEAQAAGHAALRMTDADLEVMRRQIDRLADDVSSPDWPERAIDFDLRFHDTLARNCGNGRLERDIRRYRQMVRGFCRLSGSQETLQQALNEHEEILTTLERRDGDAARKAMTKHITARLQAVLERLPRDAEASARASANDS